MPVFLQKIKVVMLMKKLFTEKTSGYFVAAGLFVLFADIFRLWLTRQSSPLMLLGILLVWTGLGCLLRRHIKDRVHRTSLFLLALTSLVVASGMVVRNEKIHMAMMLCLIVIDIVTGIRVLYMASRFAGK